MKNDAIIEKLLEHDKRLDRIEENMATKVETREIMQTLDGMMVILQRLDQERIFTNETIRRIQQQLNEQQKDLDQVKKILKIS
jgi:uncharacterized protein YjgD (DUF1641 family)